MIKYWQMISIKTNTSAFEPEELKMQKVVIFIEHNELLTFSTDYKLGHLFGNRFAIDEDARFEVLKFFELGKTSWKDSVTKHSDAINISTLKHDEWIKQHGMDHFT